MAKERKNSVHAIYIIRRCIICGVDDLGNYMHETTCMSDEAKVERGERMSSGEVLDEMIKDWRKTHPDPKVIGLWAVWVSTSADPEGGWNFIGGTPWTGKHWTGSQKEAEARAEAIRLNRGFLLNDIIEARPYK